MESNQESKSGILADHTREGKLFKTPLSRLPLQETSWIKQSLPELLWIGLLQEFHGLAHGVDLSLALAEETIQAKPDASNLLQFVDTSSYAVLEKGEWEEIRRALAESGKLSDIERALVPLTYFYSECPLIHLFEKPPNRLSESTPTLNAFKTTLESLYDKRERPATLVQVTAVYIALVTGRMMLASDMSLGNLEAVKDYPGTEESQKVAASARAACNFLVGNSVGESDSRWTEYFWSRGFELEPCQYDLPYTL